jgi:NAD/NADP transhydrogenase beta subunit
MIRQTILIIAGALVAFGALLGVAVARAMRRGVVCCAPGR